MLSLAIAALMSQQPDRQAALNSIEVGAKQGPFKPNWESLEGAKVPDWYRDAKFGIFIHWGLYSVPAFGSEWYPRQMYEENSAEFKHHLATFGPQAKFGYKDFIPQFKAEKFDPLQWALLFKRAGAKFVVPVAEHHDGFPMYDTQWSDWSAAKMGPKRDLIGDLAKAIRSEGLIFGLSSHRAEHWWFFNGGRKFDSDVSDPRYAGLYGPAQPENVPPDKAYLDDWLLRTSELIDKYRPQLVWFDWWIEQPVFKPYLQEFASYYYNQADKWRKGVAINYKNSAFPTKAAVLDLERGQLSATRSAFWQTDTSVSKNSWGHIEGQDYKSARSIVGDLVDIVSKNGALLLNIGPRSDGTIPLEEQHILLEMGSWLQTNGEAIYGSRPFRVFGEGPTQVGGGMFTDTARQDFTNEDFRFTVKGNTVYAICMARPDGEAIIKSLALGNDLVDGRVTGVSLLGFDGRLEWNQQSDGLHIKAPSNLASSFCYTFRISGLKNVAFDDRVRQRKDGTWLLSAGSAALHGPKLQVESQGGRQDIGYWDDASAWVSWQITCPKAGRYIIDADIAAQAGPSEVTVELAGHSLRVPVPQTSSWADFRTVPCGSIDIPKAGIYTLSIHPCEASRWKAINLSEVRLRP
jgi:alpha-L-fucosidase